MTEEKSDQAYDMTGHKQMDALQDAHLYEAERRRATQLAVVSRVARQVASVLDPRQLSREVVTAIQQSFGYHNVALFLLDKDAHELAMLAVSGAFEGFVPPDYRQAVGVGMIGLTAQTGEPLLANDVSQEPRYLDGLAMAIPTRSELCVPLKAAGQIAGVLDVQDTELNAFDETDLVAMGTLADQIAIAIENARLYEEAQSRARRLAVVNRIARAVGATLQLDDLLETVYEEVQSTFEVDAFMIALCDREQGNLDFQFLVDQGVREPPAVKPLGVGWTSIVVTTGEPLLVRDKVEYDRLPQTQTWGTMRLPSSWLGVPMKIGTEVTGVICVQSYRPSVYGQEEQMLLSTIADQVAVAIAGARLYDAARQELAERRQVEEKLRSLKEFHEDIIQNVSEGIVVVDRQGFLVFANPAATALLDYTLEDLLGQHWTTIVPPDQRPIVEAADERRRHGIADRYELDLTTRENERIPVLVGGSPRFEEGEFSGTLAVFTDFSERKQDERKREQLIQELQDALARVKTLSGLLPICASCKKIRDDQGYWHQVEIYVRDHSDVNFSHGICPDCAKKLYPELIGDTE